MPWCSRPPLSFQLGFLILTPFISAALWDWACPNTLNRWASHKGPCFSANWCPTWLITPKYQTQNWYSGSWSHYAMGLEGSKKKKKMGWNLCLLFRFHKYCYWYKRRCRSEEMKSWGMLRGIKDVMGKNENKIKIIIMMLVQFNNLTNIFPFITGQNLRIWGFHDSDFVMFLFGWQF